MLATVDTNILIYAEGFGRNPDESGKSDTCRALVGELLRSGRWFVAAQCFAETFNVLTRKAGLNRAEASDRIARLRLGADIVATTSELLTEAMALAVRHRIQIFDAIILAAAAEARCTTLYSEDLQHGFEWRGVRIVNPFL